MDTRRPFDAVIWDMDGTMFDTERLHQHYWAVVCERHGYTNAGPTIAKVIGMSVNNSNDVWRGDLGADFPVDELRAEKNALIDAIIERDGLPMKEGLMQVLEWLEQRGMANAVASSTRREKIVRFVRSAGLAHHFKAIVGGDEVTFSKPSPDIFLESSKRLGIVPERCLVFEDSHNGVIAALDAGMHVIMVPDLVEPTEELSKRVHRVSPSLTHAIPYLREILGG